MKKNLLIIILLTLSYQMFSQSYDEKFIKLGTDKIEQKAIEYAPIYMKKISPNTGHSSSYGGRFLDLPGLRSLSTRYNFTIPLSEFNYGSLNGAWYVELTWIARRNSLSPEEKFGVSGIMYYDMVGSAGVKFIQIDITESVKYSWSDRDINNMVKVFKSGKEIYDYLYK